jgi:hypothetical protein
VGCAVGDAAARGRSRGAGRAAKLAARVRALSAGRGRKTDEADAVSVGVAAWTATSLVSVQFDELALALRAWSATGAPTMTSSWCSPRATRPG